MNSNDNYSQAVFSSVSYTYMLHQRVIDGRTEYAWLDSHQRIMSPIWSSLEDAKKWRLGNDRQWVRVIPDHEL